MLKITFQEQKFWKLKTRKENAEGDEGLFLLYHCIQDQNHSAISVLTLKSLYCLDIHSADVN